MKAFVTHQQLYKSIRSIIALSRKNVVSSVNTLMVRTYFEIGRSIVEYEQAGQRRAKYAKETLKNLSKSLTSEFGKGYSVDNLELMRLFYLEYSGRYGRIARASSGKPSQKSETLSRISETPFRLSWSHYVQLLKIKDKKERKFYEIETTQNSWSVRELQRQYHSSLYERLALSRDKKGVRTLAKKGQIVESPKDALKDSFVLEFLDLQEGLTYTESELETAIINKLEHFMLELGKGFLFEGRQRRLTFDSTHFYVDLVFYNRLLRCFVLFDLKIGKLTHQDIGQMQMYVNYYDRIVKLPEESATIGIVLCKEDSRTIVEFTLPEGNKQIFSREYKLYLPSKTALRKQLE